MNDKTTNKCDNNFIFTRCRELNNTNAYVHFVRLFANDIVDFPKTSSESLNCVMFNEDNLIYTNQQLDLYALFDEWSVFAQAQMQRINNNYENGLCFGQRTDIMIDNNYNDKQIMELCKRIINDKYVNLPCYVYKYAKGKGTYLAFYVCNRYFYGENKEEQVLYSADLYKNKNNGRMAKKDDPNAVCVHKKGEVKYIVDTTFSLDSHEKLFPTQFGVKSKSKFIAAKKEFDDYMIDLFKEFGSNVQEETVSLPHISFDEQIKDVARESKHPVMKNDYNRIKEWNYIVKKEMTDLINKYVPSINELYCSWYDEETYKNVWHDLKVIIQKTVSRIRQCRFNYVSSNHRFKFTIHYKSKDERASEARELFYRTLEDEMKTFERKWLTFSFD